MIRRSVLACAALALAVPCLGGNDQDFHAVVNAIEMQYGVHHMRIPLLGLATLCLRVSGTPGSAGLKVAVFEHMGTASGISDDSLEQAIARAIGGHWAPLVKVRSRADGELTIVYANPDPNQLRVLVLAVEKDEATVVQTGIKASQMLQLMREPEEAAEFRGEAIGAQEN